MISALSGSPALLLILISASTHAEPVNISGTVRNPANKPVAGATISLAGDTAIRTTTDSVWKFILTGQITHVEKPAIEAQAASIAVRGRFLSIVLAKSSPVSISYYTAAGRKLFGASMKNLEPGANVLALPNSAVAAGYSIIMVECEGNRHIFRSVGAGASEFISTGAIHPKPWTARTGHCSVW